MLKGKGFTSSPNVFLSFFSPKMAYCGVFLVQNAAGFKTRKLTKFAWYLTRGDACAPLYFLLAMPMLPFFRFRNDLKCVEWDVKPCSIQFNLVLFNQ